MLLRIYEVVELNKRNYHMKKYVLTMKVQLMKVKSHHPELSPGEDRVKLK